MVGAGRIGSRRDASAPIHVVNQRPCGGSCLLNAVCTMTARRENMIRNLMCGMAAGLPLIGAAARADDGGTADQKSDIAGDVAKLKADNAAVQADKAKVKAAHEQVVDDRQQLAKDRAAHDKTAVAADKRSEEHTSELQSLTNL